MKKIFSALALLCLFASCKKHGTIGKTAIPYNGPVIYFEASPQGSPYSEIYSVHSDGTNEQQITDFSRSGQLIVETGIPVLSPDGAKLFFISNKDAAGGELFSMNLDGSNLVKIIPHDIVGSSFRDFTIFQNGQKILYTLELDSFMNRHGAIFTADINGSNRVRLTNYPADGNCINAQINPANSIIVYSNLFGGSTELYLMDVNGANKRPLTNSGAPYKMHPQFSPDGTKIVFSAVVANPGLSYPGREIFIVNTDGTNMQKLTNSTVNGSISYTSFGATFSKNGQSIYFSGARGFEISQLYKMNIDGTGLMQLTSTALHKFYPFIKE